MDGDDNDEDEDNDDDIEAVLLALEPLLPLPPLVGKLRAATINKQYKLIDYF